MSSSVLAAAGPMTGVRVVDFTHILAGPLCTQLLSDAGADVVKIEPQGGEFARQRGAIRPGRNGTSISAYHAAINRGKRSIELDLKNEHGLAVARRLLEGADIVVQNFAPGALTRLGLDLNEMRMAEPRLITASISLFGSPERAGSLGARAGLAIVGEAESSLTSMTRDREGVPMEFGLPLGDMATGLGAYAALATALFERERTGIGRHLDISMVSTLMTLNACGITGAQIPAKLGGVATVAYGIYPAADGFVTIGCNNDSLFGRFCEAAGLSDLIADPRFSTWQARLVNVKEGDALVAEWTRMHTIAEIMTILEPSGVPFGQVSTPADVLANSDFRGAQLFETVADGLGATIDTPTNPFGFHREGRSIPLLGEHTYELLAESGLSASECEELAALGAFGRAPRFLQRASA